MLGVSMTAGEQLHMARIGQRLDSLRRRGR